MYQAVASHPGIKKLYQDRLIEDNVISLDECKNFEKNIEKLLSKESLLHTILLQSLMNQCGLIGIPT